MARKPDFRDLETAGQKGKVDYARWSQSLKTWEWWYENGHLKDRAKFKPRFERLCIDGYLPEKQTGRRGAPAFGHSYGDNIFQVNISTNWRAMYFREGAFGDWRWYVTHFFESGHDCRPDKEIEKTRLARSEQLAGNYSEILEKKIQEREPGRRTQGV